MKYIQSNHKIEYNNLCKSTGEVLSSNYIKNIYSKNKMGRNDIYLVFTGDELVLENAQSSIFHFNFSLFFHVLDL